MAFDVAIIGAGIVGAACAHALSNRGFSVAVIDRSLPASGTSSHCEGNLLVSDKGAGPELDLARHSIALWENLAQSLGEELGPKFPSVEFEPKGASSLRRRKQGRSH